MSHKQAEPETEQEPQEDASDTDCAYQCPHCDATYQHEEQARVHITRADDDAHHNHNGLMPEEEIEVVDENGEVVTTITRQPAEIDLSDVTCADFNDGLSEKRKHALVVATKNPEEDTRRRITELVAERLESDEYQTTPPSESTVSRALDAFYHPHETNQPTDEAGESNTLAELTPKQQAIIIAKLADPTASNWAIAEMVGCAKSYPKQVIERYSDIVESLEHRVASGHALSEVITDALTAADIQRLRDNGVVTDLPIDCTALIAELTDDDRDPEASSTTEQARANGAESNAHWGSPVENRGALEAVPADLLMETDRQSKPEVEATQPADSGGDDAADSAATASTPNGGSEISSNVNGVANDGMPDGDSDDGDPSADGEKLTAPAAPASETAATDRPVSVPPVDEEVPATRALAESDDIVTELRRLQQRVRFFRRIMAPTIDADDDRGIALSLARQIEQDCALMLDRAEQS